MKWVIIRRVAQKFFCRTPFDTYDLEERKEGRMFFKPKNDSATTDINLFYDLERSGQISL